MTTNIAIRTPTILIVRDQCKRLLMVLTESDLGHRSIIAADTATAWELFKSSTVALVLFDGPETDTLSVGRAMRQWNPRVPMVVVARNWEALEEMEFADVLLSSSADPGVLVRHIKAQLDVAQQRAA